MLPPLETDGPRVAAFSRRYLRHTIGRWAGQPLIYEPWQQEILDEAFRIDPATGLRVYHEVVVGIPRKNGKSTKAAGVGLYLLAADGENEPEVYVAAAAKHQAGKVFRQVKGFVDVSINLSDFVRTRQYHLECPANRGTLSVISSDAVLQHGLNPHGNIIDELWAHKNGDLYTALTSGGGAREQPLTFTITTAGFDQEQVLGQIYNAALGRQGLIERRPYLTIVRDPETHFLLWWYGISEDDDPEDPAVWRGVNPASWITLEYLRSERSKPSMRWTDFQRFHLNGWVDVEELWLPAGSWTACREPGDLADLAQMRKDDPFHGINPRWPVAVGIDYGSRDDTSAVSVAQRWPMPEGRRDPERPSPDDLVGLRTKFFYPRPDQDEATDVAAIMDELRQLKARFPAQARAASDMDPELRRFTGPIFAYDPWGFEPIAGILRNEGLAMVKSPQNDARMVPASTDLYTLVTSRRLRHDGDPTLAQHVANVVGRPRGEAGWRITKLPRSVKKIDGAVASAMAVHEALMPWPERHVVAFVA